MILIVDFGGQTCHLIGRRVRALGCPVLIVEPKEALSHAKKQSVQGIIFSGGPASVYAKGSPHVPKELLELNIPVLGICYGQQLIGYLLGGEVKPGKTAEYGPAKITLKVKSEKLKVFKGLPSSFNVWMSHGDEVVKPPPGFVVVGQTDDIPVAAMASEQKNIYCVQFHPEVKHTQYGDRILRNFVLQICEIVPKRKHKSIPSMIASIRKQVGKAKVIGAVSGGVDSTVAAVLVGKAIGKQFIPIYVNNGLMRVGTKQKVSKIFQKYVGIDVLVIDAQAEFLKALKGVAEPEEKRRIIGNLYVEIFEREAKKLRAKYLVQGTIYSDVIESKGTTHSAKIKSHHNVGGLPAKMHLVLLEPLRDFYKDEVRLIGKRLRLTDDIVWMQPFPGPGHAVRIIGEVTKDRLKHQQKADKIVVEEITKAGLRKRVFQAFPIQTGVLSTAVKGDSRVYGEVVAIRAYESKDIMTALWTRLPYDVLQHISSRIVNEVPGVSRVVYDITTKPPATMEWE